MSFEFKLPDIGEGVVEGEIVRWLIKVGDKVAEDQPMVEVMTDKATVEIASPVKGAILKTVGAEGDVIQVGETMVVIQTDGATSPAPAKEARKESAPAPPPKKASKPSKGAKVLATPAVRRLAREKGIDLSQLEGSGSGGRVTKEDLARFESDQAPAAPAAAEATEIPYRGLRRRIGDHLVASKRFAPHYTYVEEVDATELVKLRRHYLNKNPQSGLTYLPFLIRAVVKGLKKFPLLNSTLDEDKQAIRVRPDYNIGVATATAEGLIVPVVKHADRKGILELSNEIDSLAKRAQKGDAKLDDLKDGTFTITSLGMLGGLLATPIINYPEVAILGVHKITERPVVRDGRVVVRSMMNLSLSLDHRVVDGIIGAQFLQEVISFVESPGLLAIEE